MFDFKNPDYKTEFARRLALLTKLRKDPGMMAAFKIHYKENPADFINDWGVTYDPRNILLGRTAVIPFVLFDRQREFLAWFLERMKTRTPGACPKSRDMGASWLAVSLADTLCLFNDGMAIGFGSRKEEYVDKSDSPKSLFYKARMFLKYLPLEFRGGFDPRRHSPHMRISFPLTGSVISGEAGDGIGRGDRTGVYIVDEAAYLERPMTTEASLSQTTDCRIDLSSINGSNNPFYDKLSTYPEPQVFRFHWRDDPRKGEDWYAQQVARLDPVTLAQEVDMDPNASKPGILIPSAWVQSAIGAAEKLGINISGPMLGALDVADEGIDTNAFAAGRGIELSFLDEWSGKGDDIYGTTVKAFGLADDLGVREFQYDADGLGSGVRGDAKRVNAARKAEGRHEVTVEAFRGSGEIVNPEAFIDGDDKRDKNDPDGRKNIDFFANFKAQSWWSLRMRFKRTHEAVVDGAKFDPDSLISISPDLPLLRKLTTELSQPTYKKNDAGKVAVNKAPIGSRSPNLADSVNIRFSPKTVKSGGFLTRKRVSHGLAR